ncbi:MAG: hypothetical protein H6819_05805 [Phycisphaerales bacterium]|nr:hypothetical protein [Phycisphaerales bacterium]MCB9858665.1 hypothetical protein [Phycisphaerales bacterium]
MLKSLILEKTGEVFDNERGYSFGFDKCIAIASQDLRFLSPDHCKFLSMLDNLRDSAVHYYHEASEHVLYIFAQASASLFNELLRNATGKGLLQYLPSRVLPISTLPPTQLASVLDSEFEQLRLLLRDPKLSKARAIAMLRPLMAFKIAGEESPRRMTNAELEVAVENLRAAENWRIVFPEVAHIRITCEGEGLPVGFKVVKSGSEAIPVRVLKETEAEKAEGVIIMRDVDIFDKFNMGLNDLAKKLALSPNKTLAMVREFKIQKDAEAYRELRIGRTPFKRYSKKALDFLRDRIDTADECWTKQRIWRKKKM